MEFNSGFKGLNIQGDKNISVHLTIYCNHQVHRDFLIALFCTKSLRNLTIKIPTVSVVPF